MGRSTGGVSQVRRVLRRFDQRGVVQATDRGVLSRLLEVDWSSHFAREVLTGARSCNASLSGLSSRGPHTVSVVELLKAYQSELLVTVDELLRLQPVVCGSQAQSATPAKNRHNGLLHSCALFGWDAIARFLLASGASPVDEGEHGLLPWECAEACGWPELATELELAAARVRSISQSKEHQIESTVSPSFWSQMLPGGASATLMCPMSGAFVPATRDWANASLPAVRSDHIPEAVDLVDEVLGETLSMVVFKERYFRKRRPLLIRGGAGQVPALDCTPSDLVEALGTRVQQGGRNFELCSIPYAEDFMPRELARVSTWPGGPAEILRGDVGYLFLEVMEGSSLAAFLDCWLPLPSLLPFAFQDEQPVLCRQFAMGQSGTGAPWHWHQDAFNICLVGERTWFFRSPAKALMSRLPVHEGIAMVTDSLMLVQRPGDIVYVPELWAHSVLNNVLSVAVALEFGTL